LGCQALVTDRHRAPSCMVIWEAQVLQKLGAHIRACLDLAAEADQRAKETSDPIWKAEHSEMARRWRHFARSYLFIETLERFLLDSRKLANTVPDRAAVCPCCGKQMHLIRSEPHGLYRNLDLYYFTCDCGHDTQTYVARDT